jgi:hypothetical protein
MNTLRDPSRYRVCQMLPLHYSTALAAYAYLITQVAKATKIGRTPMESGEYAEDAAEWSHPLPRGTDSTPTICLATSIIP